MNIAVVGLGLIGGSFCKAIKAYTNHAVFGIDSDPDAIDQAFTEGAIDREIDPEDLGEADLTLLCLYPGQTIRFLEEYATQFTPGSIVCDTCGIKYAVVTRAEQLLVPLGVKFVGLHPMAGREFSGFAYSKPELYHGASLVVCKTAHTDPEAVRMVEALAAKLGFGMPVYADAQQHDKIIAFTSQLAHVVSNAYMKSPTAMLEHGFTGGSFQDLTRVAQLNAGMWTELFLLNREPLLNELNGIIDHLCEYRDALADANAPQLKQLLQDGSDLKKESLRRNKK